MTIETQRLKVRHADKEKDAENYFRLYSDAVTMKYFKKPENMTLETTRERLITENTIECLTVFEKTGAFVGYCGLKSRFTPREATTADQEAVILLLGFYTQKRYGPELFRRLEEYAKETLKAPRLIGIVNQGNEPCLRMLRNVAMTDATERLKEDDFVEYLHILPQGHVLYFKQF